MRIAHSRRMNRVFLPFAALLSIVSCGGGGGSPTEPSPASPGPGTVVQGQTVNAVDGTPASNLSVRIGGRFPMSTDGSGFFQVDVHNTSAQRAVIEGSAFVERETQMTRERSADSRVDDPQELRPRGVRRDVPDLERTAAAVDAAAIARHSRHRHGVSRQRLQLRGDRRATDRAGDCAADGAHERGAGVADRQYFHELFIGRDRAPGRRRRASTRCGQGRLSSAVTRASRAWPRRSASVSGPSSRTAASSAARCISIASSIATTTAGACSASTSWGMPSAISTSNPDRRS